MIHFTEHRALAAACVATLAGWVLSVTVPAKAQGQALDCFRAYFEIAPDYSQLSDISWTIPSPPNDVWTEVYPNPGVAHPQSQFLDHGFDGLITKDDEIVEAGVLPSWSVAWIGTVLRITPVEFTTGSPMPIGPQMTTWWPDYVYRCPSGHCPDPDTLTILQPDFGERIVIAGHSGVWTYDFPVAVGEFLVTYGPEGESWYEVNAITCGVVVAPDLATRGARPSWGEIKRLYR